MGLEHTVLGPFPRATVAPAKANDRSSVYSTLLLYITFPVPPQLSLRHSDHTGSEQNSSWLSVLCPWGRSPGAGAWSSQPGEAASISQKHPQSEWHPSVSTDSRHHSHVEGIERPGKVLTDRPGAGRCCVEGGGRNQLGSCRHLIELFSRSTNKPGLSALLPHFAGSN